MIKVIRHGEFCADYEDERDRRKKQQERRKRAIDRLLKKNLVSCTRTGCFCRFSFHKEDVKVEYPFRDRDQLRCYVSCPECGMKIK